jgi:hypothetical protein
MSDTIYGLECLVRERARAIEREVSRRQRLALARGRQRRAFFGKRSKGIAAWVLRVDRILRGRIQGAAEGSGMGGCRR